MNKIAKIQIPVVVLALLLTTLFFIPYENCSGNLPKTESPEELIKKKLPPDKIFKKAIKQVDYGEKAIQESYVQALKHYQNALELVEAILNHYPSSELALNISLGNQKIGNYIYAQAGMFNQALQIAQEIESTYDKTYALIGIGANLAQSKAILDPETQKLLHQLSLSLL